MNRVKNKMNSTEISSCQNKLLFVVSAPSGTGKTSLCNEAVKGVSNLGFSISHTTRIPRQGEKNGKNYFFVSRKEFMESVSQNKMAEWAENYGSLYGTARDTIQTEFKKGVDLLLDIDEQGARQLSETYPDLVTVLVLPPSLKDLKKRLVERATDSEKTVQRRLKKAEEEIEKMSSWYKYIIVNDIFEDAVANLKAVILAERCKKNHKFIELLINDNDYT